MTQVLIYLCRCLLEIGETPLPAFTKTKRRIEHKMDKLMEAMKGLILKDSTDINTHECEIIAQSNEKLLVTTKRSEQLQILTILPWSWSRKRIHAEFGVSDYMARMSKQPVQVKGILTNPNPKAESTLPFETVKVLINFYESDEISWTMPGKKDLGRRVHVYMFRKS